MRIRHESALSVLGMTTQAPKTLAAAGITTVGQLLAHSRDHIADLRGMGAARMADIDAAMDAFGLAFGMSLEDPCGTAQVCGTCPRCPTCGNLRATTARNVTTDVSGRAGHVGFRTGPVCDDCHEHHLALVADATAALTEGGAS